jgi:glycosyltransferase involved in cell wall biosynthesis
MRLCYVGPVPPQRGGIAQHGARLVEALGAAGHEVNVEAWGAPYPKRLYPGDQSDTVPPGAVLQMAGAATVRRTLTWWNPVSWWLAGRRARSHDAVIIPWWSTSQGAAVRTVLAASGRGTRAVMLAHNVLPHERHWGDRAITLFALRHVDAAVVHTEDVADQLRNVLGNVPTWGAALPPILVVPVRPLPPGPPWHVLVFGHVRTYKGLDLALATVKELVLRDVPVTVTVAGQFWGPIEPWLDRLQELGLDGVVRLCPGYVADGDLDALFADHHLVLAAYRSATQSGVVPLAASAGRASVVTPVGGLSGQVVNGVDGVVATGLSPPEVADAVELALGKLGELGDRAAAGVPRWVDVARAVTDAAAHATTRN